MPLLHAIALALVLAGGTSWAGWTAVPALAFGVGVLRALGVAPVGSGLVSASAALAWAGLLAGAAARGPLWLLAARVGGVLGVPAVALVLVTIAYAALLAWSAAVLGNTLTTALRGRARPLARDGRGG